MLINKCKKLKNKNLFLFTLILVITVSSYYSHIKIRHQSTVKKTEHPPLPSSNSNSSKKILVPFDGQHQTENNNQIKEILPPPLKMEVVPKSVLELEKQYREGKIPTNDKENIDIFSDSAISIDVVELEKQYREGKIATITQEDNQILFDEAVTTDVTELERQFRDGLIPLVSPNDIDLSSDAVISPETQELEASYRKEEK